MIKTRVEHALLLGRGLDLHLRELLLPCSAQKGELGVEVAGRDVAARLFGADVGDAHFHVDQCVAEVQHTTVSHERNIGEKGEEDGVGIAIVPASTDAAVTTHLAVADNTEVAAYKLLALTQVGNGVFAKEVGDVDEEGCRGRRIVNAVEGAAVAGGDLRADAVGVGRGVVTQRDGLVEATLRIGSPGKSVVTMVGNGVDGSRGRVNGEAGLDEHIAILLAAASAADVGLREAKHGLGHRRPASVRKHTAVRARLHHAERHARPWERAPHAHAAYARVDMLPTLTVTTEEKAAKSQ